MSARTRTKTEAAYLLSGRRKDEMLQKTVAVLEALYSPETARNYLRLDGISDNIPSYAAQNTLRLKHVVELRKFLGGGK